MAQSLVVYHKTVEHLIEGWLFEKKNSKSGSARTDQAYRETIINFRMTLQRGGLDLDSEDVHTIADVATIWAGLRSPESKRDTEVAASTYNLRISIVASFYSYCQEQARSYGADVINPMKMVKKRKVQAYANVEPLDGDEVMSRLSMINRRTLVGKRDYALLAVALMTGRRASELVALRWRHVKQVGKRVTLLFEKCKGGKTMRDSLDQDATKVLMDYLHAVYGKDLSKLDGESPLWISFSRQNKGQAISVHALKDICETYLDTGKIHALRHTFAVELEKAGAPISEVSARLGHTDEKTTSIYLKQARSAENPYASKLSSRFGIGR